MFHASNRSSPVHESEGEEEFPERQRAAPEYRERGEGQPPVARLRLFPTDIDGHEPGGRDGGRVGPPLFEQAPLPPEGEGGGRQDAVPAETRQDHQDPFQMQDAVSRGQGQRSHASARQNVEFGHRPRFT